MRAELKEIIPNDYPDWETFASSERPEPWDDFGWFTLDIGDEDSRDDGTETFQVLVATATALPRVKGDRGGFRGVIVEVFEPEVVRRTLCEHVSSFTGHTWDEIRNGLRRTMIWDREGM
jgi:hypothetical protein